MNKLVFKNNVLNVILGALLMIAISFELVGLIGSSNPDLLKFDYIGLGLKYVLGGMIIIFAIVNLYKGLSKKNGFWIAFIQTIGNAIIVTLGVILIFEKDPENKGITSSQVLGLSLYIEGIILILSSSIKKLKIYVSIVGIIVITFGVIIFFLVKSVYLVFGITALIFVLGLIFLVAGIAGLSKLQKNANKIIKENEKAKLIEEENKKAIKNENRKKEDPKVKEELTSSKEEKKETSEFIDSNVSLKNELKEEVLLDKEVREESDDKDEPLS